MAGYVCSEGITSSGGRRHIDMHSYGVVVAVVLVLRSTTEYGVWRYPLSLSRGQSESIGWPLRDSDADELQEASV